MHHGEGTIGRAAATIHLLSSPDRHSLYLETFNPSLLHNTSYQTMEQLTAGGVQQLIEAEGLFTNRHHPKLQVISIRRVPANALTDVYWVSLLVCVPNLLHIRRYAHLQLHTFLSGSVRPDMSSFANIF